MTTSLLRGARQVSAAATAVAQAPVPQAMVMPEPRSHTRILTVPSGRTVANSMLHRSGKMGANSSVGPTEATSRLSTSSTKTTKWGLPIDTNVPVYSFPSVAVTVPSVRLPSGVASCEGTASRGLSMSTVTSSTPPSALTFSLSTLMPESVARRISVCRVNPFS